MGAVIPMITIIYGQMVVGWNYHNGLSKNYKRKVDYKYVKCNKKYINKWDK
jgi:hypothetical protein